MRGKLGTDEKLAYYVFNICTFGVVWLVKIIIKKAIIEALPEKIIWKK